MSYQTVLRSMSGVHPQRSARTSTIFKPLPPPGRKDIADLVMDAIASASPQERAPGYNERPAEDDDPAV